MNIVRTVARTSSIGGLYVCAEVLNILKIDKNRTDLQCFIFNIGELGALFGGAKPTKTPTRRLNIVKYELMLLFTRDT